MNGGTLPLFGGEEFDGPCLLCDSSGCAARPRRPELEHHAECAVKIEASCELGVHRWCPIDDGCDWADAHRADLLTYGVEHCPPGRLLVVLLDENTAAHPVGVFDRYQQAGPARTRAARREGEPIGLAKRRGLVLCGSHLH